METNLNCIEGPCADATDDRLTAEEEVYYETIIHDPSASEEERREARDRRFNKNRKLVLSIIHKEFSDYRSNALTLEDLEQEGYIGLLKAIENYDPNKPNPKNGNKPYRFSTFASPWIEKTIKKAIADKGSPIKRPSSVRNGIKQYRNSVNEFKDSHNGKHPSDREVAKIMGCSIAKIKQLREYSRNAFPVSFESGAPADVPSLAETLPDTESPAPGTKRREDEKTHLIDTKLAEYFADDPRTEALVRLKFGFGAPLNPKRAALVVDTWAKNHGIRKSRFKKGHPLTYEELSGLLGVSRERVRQIVERGLSRLRLDEDLSLFGLVVV